MARHSDEHLALWADRFIAAGVAGEMTFDRFMSASPSWRERYLARATAARTAEASAEQALPAAAELHDQHLVDPMRPTLRQWRRPWFFDLRRLRQRTRALNNRRRHEN